MADSGLKLVGTLAEVAHPDGWTWDDIANINAVTTTFASNLNIGTGEETNYIKATNFGFAIPPLATIIGFQLSYRVRANNSGDMSRSRPFLVVGGTVTDRGATTFATPLTSSAVDYTQGDGTDLWDFDTPTDALPTVAQINSSDFGVQYHFDDVGAGDGDDAFVYTTYMTVYYNPSGTADLDLPAFTMSGSGTQKASGTASMSTSAFTLKGHGYKV